jgi:hypothetical protein
MKRLLLTLLVIAMSATGADAYYPKKSHVQLGIGSTLPMGKVADHWTNGFSANFGVAFTASYAFEVVPKIEYSHLPLELSGSKAMTGSSLNTLLIGVDFNVLPHKLKAKLSPILTGGIGLGRVAVAIYPYYEYAGLNGSAQSNVYFSFGGGFAYWWRNTPIVLLTVRSVIVQGERSSVSLLPVTLSFRFL